MVRKAARPPASSKLYRHFAVVTLVLTLGLAMFSNGETQEAAAREVAKARRPDPKGNPNDFVRKDAKQHGSFGTDEWVESDFGQPSDRGGAVPHAGVVPGDSAARPGTGFPGGYTQYGVSSAVWASLTEEQKRKLIAAQKAEQEAAASPERARQMESLLAASRARSGAAPDTLD